MKIMEANTVGAKVFFTALEDKKLLHMISRNPPLYNPADKDYKDMILRDNIWLEISKELKRSYDDCKRRWKNIKDSYNRCQRKMRMPASQRRLSKKRWYLMDSLGFLSSVSHEQDTTGNCNEIHFQEIEIETDMHESQSMSSSNVSDSGDSNSESGSKLVKRRKYNKLVESTQTKPFEQKVTNRTVADESGLDDITSFCEHMKIILRSLNPSLKIKAKNELFSVLMKYELQAAEQVIPYGYDTLTGVKLESGLD